MTGAPKKKATVFGGSGFLGSHVADCLDAEGYEVTIYDKRHSQYIRASQIMAVGDILDEKAVGDAVTGADYVFNFAGIADIDEASKRPVEGVSYNILGNTIILEACRKANIKRFVFASSLYVYSKAGSIYRSTKQACELLIENYWELFGLPYTILRFGSLYGPRADCRNIIYTMLTQALKEGKITRYGDGEELREYIHVHDAARGTVEILAEEFANQHIIITGYQKMRIKDLLYMIKEMLDNKIAIEFLPPNTELHYEITPYTFAPKVGRRLTSRTYVDLGQGILETIHDLYKTLQSGDSDNDRA
ncbi:MAG: NAD(P)-dependent oxidoreductase [Nitrospirae bacterium]|nr:NAD(P)-dependent oxidoreductase [Nitrospirota bacterium]